MKSLSYKACNGFSIIQSLPDSTEQGITPPDTAGMPDSTEQGIIPPDTAGMPDSTEQGIIPPDTALCCECLKEIYERGNRRYRYPFTGCSSCGPRYSSLIKLPYDRANTSMSVYEMCPACRNEYEDSTGRRFHYQANCCPDCGPGLILYDNNGKEIYCADPIAAASRLLCEGKLIGIKGIGGYHIACNAYDECAVARLRERKRRPDKPMAVMASGLETAALIGKIAGKEEEILTGRQRPIVLLEKRLPELLPYNVAPGVNSIGVVLPYTPLHHLLFNKELHYLVMTSGNISGMPICYRDEDAFERLKYTVDYYLVHDRAILTPIDDSVVRVIDGKEMVSRSARGYSPIAFRMGLKNEIMAVGAEQKASICLLHKGYAQVTQYLGQLEDMSAYKEYLQAMYRMKMLVGAEPKLIAHDLHTGYLSTQWALRQAALSIPIQHHHAHIAACMAEHDIKQNVIGIIYDGTGLGTDGAIWGGEFFIGSGGMFTRVGHWKYITLQGGDSAVSEPWKSAASYLHAIGVYAGKYLDGIDKIKLDAISDAIKHNINCFQSSSLGRLFDCVSALVMKRLRITYDAQAAIELEGVIEPDILESYRYSVNEKEEQLVINYEEIVLGILEDITIGRTASYISAKFHNSICEATIDCTCRIGNRYGISDIVLGGGVFENMYLLKTMKRGLYMHGFNIYHNLKIPINDGGISFGQAAAAAHIIKEANHVSGCSGNNYSH